MTADEHYMALALEEARLALAQGNWPIGCVIVLHDRILARAHNLVRSTPDRLAHAEMLALRAAGDELSQHPGQATLYTTYEPCPMCFGACILSKVKRVVCGIDLDQSGSMHFRDHLPLLFKQDKFRVEFDRGVLADACAEVFLKGEPTKSLLDAGLVRTHQPDRADHKPAPRKSTI